MSVSCCAVESTGQTINFTPCNWPLLSHTHTPEHTQAICVNWNHTGCMCVSYVKWSWAGWMSVWVCVCRVFFWGGASRWTHAQQHTHKSPSCLGLKMALFHYRRQGVVRGRHTPKQTHIHTNTQTLNQASTNSYMIDKTLKGQYTQITKPSACLASVSHLNYTFKNISDIMSLVRVNQDKPQTSQTVSSGTSSWQRETIACVFVKAELGLLVKLFRHSLMHINIYHLVLCRSHLSCSSF